MSLLKRLLRAAAEHFLPSPQPAPQVSESPPEPEEQDVSAQEVSDEVSEDASSIRHTLDGKIVVPSDVKAEEDALRAFMDKH